MSHTEAVLGELADAQTQITQLFDYFDKDQDGYLDFSEVAVLFKQLSPEQSTESACNAAAEALLMSDSNVDTKLSRQEFEQLLIKVSGLSGVPLLEAANKMLATTQQPSAATGAAEAEVAKTSSTPGSSQAAVEAATAAAATAAEPPAGASTGLQKSEKLLTLFGLWDKSGEGKVNFVELCQGLAKFKPITGKKDMASLISEAASVLAVHDVDGDRQLGFDEFGCFMSRFMAAAGFQLEEVLEELATLAATKPDSKKLQQVLDNAQPQIERLLSGKQQ